MAYCLVCIQYFIHSIFDDSDSGCFSFCACAVYGQKGCQTLSRCKEGRVPELQFSRFWYKERYHFSRFWHKERYQFSQIAFSNMLFRKIGKGRVYILEKLVKGTVMLLKLRWHVPIQKLVKYPPPGSKCYFVAFLRICLRFEIHFSSIFLKPAIISRKEF